MISEKIMEINIFIKILSVLMFLLSLCMKLNSVYANEVRCIDRERQALLKFKHGLVDDRGILSSWGSEEVKKECCKWKGISCSNRTGHVVSLDMHVPPSDGYVYLEAAKLIPALLELQNLNYLDLSFVDFGSEIPKFIGSFKKLRHLNLSGTFFIGEVPCELGNLTNPHTLDLRYNDLRIKNLEWLSHLSLMSFLDLSHNDFGRSEIPRFFGYFKKLRRLKLSVSNFTGEVPCELGNLTNLHTLNLHENNFRIKNLEWLSHLSLLSYLDLSGVNLMNQTSWLHHMTRFPFLEELFLSYCRLPNIMPSFNILTNSSLPYLSILDLSSNDLTSSFAFHWLFNFSASLTSIDLSHN
ncbi:receptor 12 [Olea europaea subsp. europaea]|uniref:Receptor 12 n=2 Tax=Olea europaea subsp. europaea TaxID=158383 RepID=A0A8S0UYB6_OLEEU|nr:receptor 12 [Olea europaea subsp. europaea]